MNISKLYEKIKACRDRDRSKLYITPFREWNIILFLSTILIISTVFFCYRAFNDIYINSFKEENISQVETDPYKIEDIKFKLSKILQYYKERENEHNVLLEKQPLFENKVNIVKSSDLSGSQDKEEKLEEDIDILTKPESSEGGSILEVFDHLQSNISNAASVLKAFFIDLSK